MLRLQRLSTDKTAAIGIKMVLDLSVVYSTGKSLSKLKLKLGRGTNEATAVGTTHIDSLYKLRRGNHQKRLHAWKGQILRMSNANSFAVDDLINALFKWRNESSKICCSACPTARAACFKRGVSQIACFATFHTN